MGRWKTWKALLGCLALTVLCTGCIGRSADELYALPRQSDAYYDLQNAIDQVMTPDAAYAGPLTGSNQQAVQLADLDGDEQDEAIVFTKAGGEKPLKAYIFDQNGGVYENTAVIEGDGSGFDAVEYAQVDGKPGLEILIGRQLNDQILQSLSVYAYTDQRLVELLNANYSEFRVADLDTDDCKDLFLLRVGMEERSGVAELYRWRDDQLEREPEAQLSLGASRIRRIITGYVASDVPAVFVASDYGENMIITDIFAMRGQSFQNISSNAETGLSTQTVRSYNVYATDIDEDGLLELPTPVVLPSADGAETTYWAIEWYNLTLGGERVEKAVTFHNYYSGWYLELPESWRDQISVSRNKEVSGVLGYTFSKWNGYDREPEEIVTIYAFTGEDRLELARTDERFLLAEKGETAYAAAFGDSDWAERLTEEELSAMFHFIHVDWNTGEI